MNSETPATRHLCVTKSTYRDVMRRPLLWILAGLMIALIALTDLTAAAVTVVGLIALALLIRYRGRRALRLTAISLVAAITLVGLVAALAVPRYRWSPDPLLVPSGTGAAHAATNRKGSFELSGFVVADNDNATNAVDNQASSLSNVVATGGLVNPDGSFLYTGVRTALIHAHLSGARGELLLQNYDTTARGGAGDFSPAFAHAVLADDVSRAAFAQSVATTVSAEHWDGVVLDFEMVAPTDQASIPALLSALRHALPPTSRLGISVAVNEIATGSSAGLDLAAITPIVDEINLMTYDQHDPTGSPGPVSALPWIKQAYQSALRHVPADKLTLGVAGYGYAWGPSAQKLGSSFSPTQARALLTQLHITPTWNSTAGEWTATLTDGTVLWWADSRSMGEVIKLAYSAKLAGAAVWELSVADPIAPALSGIPVARLSIQPDPGRTIERVPAKGLVALTFDDGPDPTWTPQILAVLAAKGVPATFFDIGMNAMAHPDIVMNEVNAGHVVGDHTYSHLDLTTIPRWRAWLEIAAGGWVLHGITGRTPSLFRSPYGAAELADSNSASHTDLAASLGLQPVGWNVDTLDWTRPGVAAITARVVNATGDNLIVLLHDGGGDRSQTVAALPGIIDDLRARGYEFVTADQLDGSISSPYAPPPTTVLGFAGAMLSIASFRLWTSSHTVVIWTMIALGLLSLARILIAWPLALLHRRRRKVRPLAAFGTAEGHAATDLDMQITVLIPAHNEEATLLKSIAALSNVHGPIVQVIIAENGSTDGTLAVAHAAVRDFPDLPLEVLARVEGGKAEALNACLPLARGDVIIVLDADTVLDPEFAVSVLPHFRDPHVGAVAGNVKVGNRRRLLPRLQSLEYIMSLSLDRRAQAFLNVVSVVPGAAGAFRRAAVIRVNGWPDRTLTEDTDLTVALLSAGWSIPYEPDAISWTEAPETVSDVLKQRRRWSFGAAQVSAIHASRMLDVREGKMGLLALPWLFIAQVLLPAAGPLVDAYLIWLILNGDWRPALGMLLLAIAAEVALAAWSLRTERESLRQLWLVPLSRLIWRPLMLVAVSGSLRSWLMGRSVAWRQLRRRNTVTVPMTPQR